MSADSRFLAVVTEITSLLQAVQQRQWTKAFEDWSARLQFSTRADIGAVGREILRAYGGMGSFNDLVLYRSGQLCVSENRRLDALRRELFEVCSAIVLNCAE